MKGGGLLKSGWNLSNVRSSEGVVPLVFPQQKGGFLMKTKIILTVAVVLMLAIGLATLSSNMGFKLSKVIAVGETVFVGLPYYNSYSTQTAAYLRNDILVAASQPSQVGGVIVYNWSGGVWQKYMGSGSGGQKNFALTPGVAYQVYTDYAVPNWVIVGSHNPATTSAVAVGETKFVSVPYHSTSTTAAQFRNELLVAAGQPSQVGGIIVYNWSGGVWQKYMGSGSGGQKNFALTPGAGYQVYTDYAIAGWLPAHY
jgi:hypothetical protein